LPPSLEYDDCVKSLEADYASLSLSPPSYLEQVMAEDAPEFTESIWRLLVEESTVASSGLLG
jgi:hypothetical protein